MRKIIPAALAGLTLAIAPVHAADTTDAAKPAAEKPDAAKPAAEKPSDTKTVSDTKMSTPAAPAAFESKDINGQKYVLVSSIKTLDANRQFQQNVKVVTAQLNQVKELQKRIEQALTLVEKEALKKVLDDTNKSLEQNNTLMAKTYGFSLLRKYQIEVVKTVLYTPLSDEEYTKAKAAPDYKADHFIVNDKAKLARIAEINGVGENQIFQQNVQLVNAQRQRLAQLKSAIDQTKDEGEKKKLEDEYKKSEETLLKNNEEMTKRYGFSLTRNYVMEFEETKLFMEVSPEEYAAQVAEAKKNGTYKEPAAAPAPKAAETPAAK